MFNSTQERRVIVHFRISRSTGSNKVRLDISDLSALMDAKEKESLDMFLLFNCSTFNIIRSYDKDPEAFDHIFKCVNFVLKHMDKKKQLEIAKFFAHANYCIKDTLGKFKTSPREMAGRSVIDFSRQLGEQ